VSLPVVLLVVDESAARPLAAELATRALQAEFIASTPHEMIGLCEKRTVDVVVVDLALLGDGALAVIEAVSRGASAPQTIAVIAHAADPRRRRLSGLGVWEHIHGDVPAWSLVGDLVGRLLRPSRSAQAPAEHSGEVVVAPRSTIAAAALHAAHEVGTHEQAAHQEADHVGRGVLALGEVTSALVSAADRQDIRLTILASAQKTFGADHALLATLSDDGERVLASHVLGDDDLGAPEEGIPCADTLMGLCMLERRAAQRVNPVFSSVAMPSSSTTPLAFLEGPLGSFDQQLFARGLGAAIAVPVVGEDSVPGALWLGFRRPQSLAAVDVQVLCALGHLVAVAAKTARLSEGRERAVEEMQAAQQRLTEAEKLHAIGLLAHGVAHDFNNVLGSILGRAQLLKGQSRDPTVVRHAEIIEKAAKDGAQTVRRIQGVSRREREDAFVCVNALSLVEDVLEFTRPRFLERQVEVTASGDDNVDIACNPAEFREVILNLVHNAIDAVDSGGRVELSARRDGADVIVSVRDFGTGIPTDVLGRIFDPYFTTKGERGTGLGLSISQSIVRRHGGELRVQSSTVGEDHGTTFAIVLPVLETTREVPATSSAPIERPGVTGRARVLVVDDEQNIRDILSEMLEGDHEVVTATDGPQAIECVRAEPRFDLAFTDLGLPGMSGYEVARELKRIQPGILIGLVTGWGATLDAEKAKQHGVDLIISKPFRFEQVRGAVNEALQARQGR
jgi:signal transduction histidine kinase/DNA-binding response OmpR family regulator